MSVLSDMTTRLVAGERPDMRSLANYITEQVQKCDPFDWESFRTVVLELYSINDARFQAVFAMPMLTKDGKAIDDFRPLMQRLEMRGFLRRYTDHLINTESPSAFHFATALTILGASLKRQVWFDQKIFQIWPAMQVLILGPSGQVAKTTSTSYGIKLAREAGTVDLIADEITPEALKKELAARTEATGQATGLIYASELSLLFAKTDSYNQGLIQSLTDLFDSRDFSSKHTKTAGNYDLKDIAVSFLACSNEGWATGSISDSAIGGGLIGRMLTFYQGGATREIPFPEFPDMTERQNLIEMLQNTAYVKGVFTVSNAARKWYEKKYHWLKTNWPEDERVDPMHTRYGVHLLRVGMLFAVNDIITRCFETKQPAGMMPRVIELPHLEMADAVLTYLYQYIPVVYQFLGISKDGEDTARVVRFIARKGGVMPHAQLMRAMSKHMHQGVLKNSLAGLLAARTIAQVDLPKPHVDGSVGYKLMRKMEEI